MQTGIQIKTEFFPLAWFLHFVTPTIEINGEKPSLAYRLGNTK